MDIVIGDEIPVVTSNPLLSLRSPENVKLLAPFPKVPLVIMYETLIRLPLSGFFPTMLSPNLISYFSSAIS